MDNSVHSETFENGQEGRRRLISLVMPVYNEEANLDRAYAALTAVFKEFPQYDLEFVFTDNHSEDRTFERLAALAKADSRVKAIRFTRNYGFQRSLLTAYRHASGDAAIQIDCDLQDPPELIPQFIALWEQGYDVVVGLRRRRQEPRLLTLGRRAFYALLSRISDDQVTRDAGDFRLVDRSVINRLSALNDFNPYVRGVVSLLASRETGIPYDRVQRIHGRSKFPLRKLVGFALDGILGHSVLPLRLASYAGLTISLVIFVLGLFYVFGALAFGRSWPSGFATIVVVTLFGISLNAIFLGIIGEYVSRIYQQVRFRPLVVVESVLNISAEQSEK
ncbi:glycosyltransferase involved in cell wall biosynthesis [Bradyrhizobium japonicum]|uniref:glycosyltransferase family 2 protein n=1 Tax=Bradyrhizobium TaxID=374 RepID=UPI0006766992|nr:MULTISPECIES: glycosyltransferase family 2 protein [Bradyrhizobium]MBR1003979.1 glycosyltransferase family 2 protein [Bradyrhizobium liaoningense]MBR1031228.1 glycosyltransferase family 2 protein [Bradyrhizobium liaoningense]MCP1743322.1 dolichol-phosphate mannosyltransferase [Bradyrhizobium japonicum]MCP1781670.1 dolichol-phosphate mannosyltransferase [Bradyrhizobium japonicum]MCP1891796.1 dolichol-phosphate mannosyltransferase [Bradyrhizobium japonicum]